MHPLIDRISAIRREKAKLLWEPEKVVLGWLSYDTLQQDLIRDYSSYEGPSDEFEAILGVPLVRDNSFPIGACITFRTETWISPYEKQTAHLAVLL